MSKIFWALALLFCLGWAETKLGAWYIVINDQAPYVTESGAPRTVLAKDTPVRLIKNETLAETFSLLPFRVLKLMISLEPRGNWLVEDDDGNRGYMWDSDLELQPPKR